MNNTIDETAVCQGETLHSSELVKCIARQNGLNYNDCLGLINSGMMSLTDFLAFHHSGEGWLIASALNRYIEDVADYQDNP